jgi:small subunit ribosomal protein S8
MTMSDPLGDMLTRIRNGQQAQHPTIGCPWSKHKEAVCSVLKEEGFVTDFAVEDLENNKKQLIVTLKYEEDGQGIIREMHRVSKPGRRVYSTSKTMPSFYNGLGVTVVSTPNGVMSDHKAKTENVGGEVLCQIF